MAFMSAAATVVLRSRATSSSSGSRIFTRAAPNSTAAFSAAGRALTPFSRLSIRAMADSAASSSPFKKIQIQRDDTTFDAYVVGKEDAPGIVVLQEWWGVDFEIKNHALKISQLGDGFKALIPDLYRGKVCLDVAEAQHAMDGLDWQGAVKDIRAAVDWLKANGSKKVGVTGFCMGGALSIASSVLIPKVDAVVAFYGVPSSELADPAQAKAPVQAHFGELDNFVGFSDVTIQKPVNNCAEVMQKIIVQKRKRHKELISQFGVHTYICGATPRQ
ncbi:Protein usf [Morus notabilis]|uniref:Protein usf n=1 Tax=Morus notabilis TaxID=981085 RepID=W9QIC5_9ROSA|nr:Protein usf [Morus notabilis]